MATTTLPIAHAGRSLTLRGRTFPVFGPKLSDPRLHLAAVVLSLQALGQTVLDFDLSIAQILVSLGTCAALELAITIWQRGVIAWPASALLTGNGIAILLRVPGTEHGDWWSLNGAHIYLAIAAVAILSKHVIVIGDRHLFNPANFGLVVGLLILGSQRADPQDLWWGPVSPAIIATLVVIGLGAVFVTARQRLFGVAAGFFLTLSAGAGLLAAAGHCITARWHVGPICGLSYWWTLVSSPEVLVFTFFMVTDPRTVPSSRQGRVAHGVLVGALACLFIAPQTTEFATKVGLLLALVVVCGLRPLLDRRFTGVQIHRPPLRRAGTMVAALVAAGVFSGTLLAADSLADDSRTRPIAAALSDIPPAREYDIPVGAVPEVAIDASTGRVQPQPTARTAQAIGRDLFAATLAEAAAVTTGTVDPALGRITGAQLDALRNVVSDVTNATGGAASPPTTSYRFDSMTLVLVPNLASPQAAPQLGIRATGTTATGTTAAGAADGADAATTDAGVPGEPFDRIFLMDDLGNNYAWSGVRDAP